MTADRPRVLLLWPGGLSRPSGHFGVPQLVSLGSVLRARAGASVDLVDLDAERAAGGVDLRRIAAPGYDLVGMSCYSSYDLVKTQCLAAALRTLLPDACFVAGGYHPSAVPEDLLTPGTPPTSGWFDYVVRGEGELPLLGLLSSLARAERPAERVLAAEAWPDLDELPAYDWSLLARYRATARRGASQAEIYLSRGCPHGCSFCMERAKGGSSWRAFSPERAVEELHRLDAFLDLSSWTLFVADALFGPVPSWRKRTLELLAQRPTRARKLWLLARIDGWDREDFALMAAANAAVGFGLESGDPAMLERMGKARSGAEHLDRVRRAVGWATELGAPFGLNVLAGHPGETEASLNRSAALVSELLMSQGAGSPGFVSIDPFRLYPGSAVAADLRGWAERTGMKAHRYPWWHDGDQELLSEWVDPSASLDYRRLRAIERQLFDPIVERQKGLFRYQGPAHEYFMAAIDEQVALRRPANVLRRLGLWHLWNGVAAGEQAEGLDAQTELTTDVELGEVARQARSESLASLPVEPSPAMRSALLRVPRELFVRLEDVGRSARDEALPLRDDGHATISALHAYIMTFAALELARGDSLVDLGGGTGYGAALAAELVGPGGHVRTLELDRELAALARRNLQRCPWVEVVAADAHDTASWQGASKVAVGFALPALPASWLAALADGGRLVAPLGPPGRQTLTLVRKDGEDVTMTDLGAVRYVADRSRAR